MGGKAGVSDAVLRGSFRECAIPVVDEQEIRPVSRFGPHGPGHRDIDVQIPIVVDVHHGGAGRPPLRCDAGAASDVIEAHRTSVQVEPARDHIAGEEDIRQAIVVDVAHGDPGAVVNVGVGLHVQRVSGGDGVREGDAGLARGQQLEERALPLTSAPSQQGHGNQNDNPLRALRPCESGHRAAGFACILFSKRRTAFFAVSGACVVVLR